jgi:PKD repeat protein
VLETCVLVPCAKDWDKRVSDKITLLGKHSDSGSLYVAYRRVKAHAATGARILVLGYPRFFKVNGSGGLGCSLILNADQRWINQKIHDMDAMIRESAIAAGIEYVNTEDAFTGHELCSGNGQPQAANSVNTVDKEYSFHPNPLGHQLLAQAVETELKTPAGTYFDIVPGATVSNTHTVAIGTGSTVFTTSWPGSDVQMTLVSPSGKTYDRSTIDPSTVHTLTATSETYQVTDPEPGQWTVKLYGADVAFAGEPASLTVDDLPVVTPNPVGAFTQSTTTAGLGTAVNFDASGSTGTATLSSYEWDFGDGTTATGVKASHTYTTVGTFVPQLVVTDLAGGHGVTEGDPIVVGGTATVAPSFTSASPPATATKGTPYSYTFTATGVPVPKFAVDSGSLPAGLTLDAITGTLSGTLTTATSSTFTIAASNGVGSPAVTAPLAITVTPLPTSGPKIDQKQSRQAKDSADVRMTTTASDTLVAFVAADGPRRGGQTATVTGGGLRWTLAGRTNAQLGSAEIWTATAPHLLRHERIRATLSRRDNQLSLTVIAFKDTNGTGAVAHASGRSGAPTATLTTSAANAWVFAVGNDWTTSNPRTVGPGQILMAQSFCRVRSTFWVQAQSSPTPSAGTSVTINDIAPTRDRWNLTLIEVL